MKYEMERIWNEERLAFPLHLARWKAEGVNLGGLWFWLDGAIKLFATKGKRLNTIIKKYRIWR